MPDSICPECGSEIPSDAARGLCSRCLLSLGLLGGDDASGFKDELDTELSSLPIPNQKSPIDNPTVHYFGDYELLEEIARGGMGVVYRARQVSLNRLIALKMIVAGQLASPAQIQRFHTEAEAAASLDHPNIVPIYEVGEHEGQSYFTMRFVEGGTLAHKISDFQWPIGDGPRGKANPRVTSGAWTKAQIKDQKSKIVRLMIQVARAVHHAHQRGIIHRDLKPGNILLDSKGEPFVSDFGLAKALEKEGDLTRTVGILGTPSYMSPEQAQGKPLTTSSDLFSLGTILYQLLTGLPPFRKENAMEILRSLVEEEPRRPRSVSPDLDADLETICLKCLEKDPARRYGSTEALADDLQHWLDGEPIQARATNSWEKTVKWARRKPAMAALGIMSIVAVLALSGIFISFPAYQEAERARIEAEAAQRQTEAALAETEIARRETEAALAKANAAHHARNMAWAEREWLANNVTRAEQILDETAPEFRRWEWHYLKSLSRTDLFTATGHVAGVRRLALTADGQRLASISSDGTLKLWDAETGVEEPPWNLDVEGLSALAFSPDGFLAAFGTKASRASTAKVFVWNLVEGRTVWTQEHAANINSLAFSPDGKLLASGSKDKTIKLWNVENGELFRDLQGHNEGVNSVSFHPRGDFLASASGDPEVVNNLGHVTRQEMPGEIKIWDIHSGDSILTFGKGSRIVHSIAYSPDGTQLASAHGDRTAKVWDAGTGGLRMTLPGHGGPVFSVSFNREGDRIATGSADSAMQVWNAVTGETMATYRGHLKGVYAAIFNADGSRVYSTGEDTTLKAWNATRDQSFYTGLEGKARIGGIAFSPDGKLAATSYGVWDWHANQLIFGLGPQSSRVGGAVFSAQGDIVAVSSGGVYEVVTGRVIQTFARSTPQVYDVAISPDGKLAAYAARSGPPASSEIHLWDIETGQAMRTLTAGTNEIWGVTFSPNGRLIAAAEGSFRGNGAVAARDQGIPGEVKVWDWQSGRLIHTLSAHKFALWSVAISPDGKLLAAGGGYYQPSALAPSPGEIIVWDLESGRELFGFHDLPDCVFSVAFSPDNTRLVSAAGQHSGRQPVELKLWDVTLGEEIFTLRGAASTVYSVAFTPDGKTIAAGCEDGNVVFWSTELSRSPSLLVPSEKEMPRSFSSSGEP
jgi:eukaryotic-like serine/threonine-protein kinase